MKYAMSALVMSAVMLVTSTNSFAAGLISEGTIHGPKGSGESLQVQVHEDGGIKLLHRQGEVLSEVSGFNGLNQTTVIMLEKMAGQRNMARLATAVPASVCAALLSGIVGANLGAALHPNQGFSTLIMAVYFYGPAAAMVGGVAGFTVPLMVTGDRKKQLQAIRALAKVSMTVVNAQVTSPMPIRELIGQLMLLTEAARK